MAASPPARPAASQHGESERMGVRSKDCPYQHGRVLQQREGQVLIRSLLDLRVTAAQEVGALKNL